MNPRLPFKSVAAALMFSVLLGPVGLLYATLWGGALMIMLGVVVISSKLLFPMILVWVSCCVWSVAAVEKHNRLLLQVAHKE